MLVELDVLNKQMVDKGVYLAEYEYNFNHELEMKGFKITDKFEPIVDLDDRYISAYGVCDDYKQILEFVPEIIYSEDRYVIGLTEVNKREEFSWGGWRWHKWGEYIGVQNPQEEYLYDEPVIEKVYCYHIYKIL
jgi:hypothetical protein